MVILYSSIVQSNCWEFSSVSGVIFSSGLGSSFVLYTYCSLIFVLHLAFDVVYLHSGQTVSFHPTYAKQGHLCPDLLFSLIKKKKKILAVKIGIRSLL